MDDVPPAGVEAAFSLVTYYADMLAQRRARPTDDLTSALLAAEVDGDRLTDDEIMGFLFLMVVAGNETTTKLLGNAWYWAWRNPDERAKPFADPGAHPRLDRGDAALRHVEPDAGPHHHRGRRAARHRDPGAASAWCWSSARPTATSACSTERDDYDLDRPEQELQQIASFGFGRHFCLGASLARLEARVCLEELVARVGRLRHRPRRHPPRPQRQRPGLRRPPHHGGPPLMPRFPPHPERRAAVVTGASSGHGRATAGAAGRGRPPRRARGPAARPARGDGGRDRGRRRRGAGAAARPDRRRVDRRLRRPGRGRAGTDRDRRVERRRRAAGHRPRGRPRRLHPPGAGERARRPPPRAAPRARRWSSGGAATSSS